MTAPHCLQHWCALYGRPAAAQLLQAGQGIMGVVLSSQLVSNVVKSNEPEGHYAKTEACYQPGKSGESLTTVFFNVTPSPQLCVTSPVHISHRGGYPAFQGADMTEGGIAGIRESLRCHASQRPAVRLRCPCICTQDTDSYKYQGIICAMCARCASPTLLITSHASSCSTCAGGMCSVCRITGVASMTAGAHNMPQTAAHEAQDTSQREQ